MARALEYVHSKKIIHRDIKPENVHLDSSGKAKLMDFGIAKAEGLPMTKAGFALGTPYYMAPEQVLGEQVSEPADVYAFGIMLFEMFTGVKPITGETVERLFYQILNEPLNLEPLRQAGLPEGLVQLVARSTAKKKEDRPQNFTEVCSSLESLIREADPRHNRGAGSRDHADRRGKQEQAPGIRAACLHCDGGRRTDLYQDAKNGNGTPTRLDNGYRRNGARAREVLSCRALRRSKSRFRRSILIELK